MKDVVKTNVAQMIADAQKEALTNGRKNINKAFKNVAKDVNNESEESKSMKTKVKDMFTEMAEKNPRLAKAIKSIKKGSVYLVKNYLFSLAITATLPALIVGGLGVVAVCKYKGGKYITNKAVACTLLATTATLAVASVVVAVAVAPVALLAVATLTTAICLAVDAWSWFKNRKTK